MQSNLIITNKKQQNTLIKQKQQLEKFVDKISYKIRKIQQLIIKNNQQSISSRSRSSKEMSSWINQSAFVRNLAQNLLTPKRTYYQEDYISTYGLLQDLEFKIIQCNCFTFKNMYIQNRWKQKLKATVFLDQSYLKSATTFSSLEANSSQFIQPQQTPQNMLEPEQPPVCIVYLHGFGSHRLQGTSILNALNPKQFALCCFDFSGSGKSQGNLTTYGIKQYLDIDCVINILKRQFGFQKFVLWGRSMGATASLLYTSPSPSLQQTHYRSQIIFQVLDSPFQSFQSIARFHANSSYSLPQIFVSIGLGILKDYFVNHQFNPFKIDVLEIVDKCKIPALFVYCQGDKVIPQENCKNIISKFGNNGNPYCKGIQKTAYERLIIPENHNNFRSRETLRKIIEIIHKYIHQDRAKCRKSMSSNSNNANEGNMNQNQNRSKHCSKGNFKAKKGIQQILSNTFTPKSVSQMYSSGFYGTNVTSAGYKTFSYNNSTVDNKTKNQKTTNSKANDGQKYETDNKVRIMKLSGIQKFNNNNRRNRVGEGIINGSINIDEHSKQKHKNTNDNIRYEHSTGHTNGYGCCTNCYKVQNFETHSSQNKITSNSPYLPMSNFLHSHPQSVNINVNVNIHLNVPQSGKKVVKTNPQKQTQNEVQLQIMDILHRNGRNVSKNLKNSTSKQEGSDQFLSDNLINNRERAKYERNKMRSIIEKDKDKNRERSSSNGNYSYCFSNCTKPESHPNNS